MLVNFLFLAALATAAELPDADKLKEIFGTPDNPKVKNPLNVTLPEPTALPLNVPTETSTVAEKNGNDTTRLEEVASSGQACTMKNGEKGVCTLYYLCDVGTRNIIKDGAELLDVRIQGSVCPHYLEVCCGEQDKSQPAPTTRKPAVKTEFRKYCGYSNLGDDESFRTINDGSTAEYLEYPWMIALLRNTLPGEAWSQKHFLGGGTLIHPQVVLTSAHKVDNLDPEEVICRAGEWDTQTTKEFYPEQERPVKKIVDHENFYKPSMLNSIALLILDQPFTGAPNIGTACLGRHFPPPATVCYGMGWGKENFNGKDLYAVILKKVPLPLTSRADCQNALRRTRLGSYFELHQSLTCAGGAERDTCKGDGGSPLVCHVGKKQDLRYAVYGMVAYGIGCGKQGIPGVYVNIPFFYSWVVEKMKEEGFGTEYFTVSGS